MRRFFGGAVVIALTGFGAAADPVDGAREFEANCALCHGEDGGGRGTYEPFLRVAPADLTVLSRENGGTFPFERVYRVIDGRTELLAHGPREMPIWGFEYRLRAERQSPQERDGKSPENVVSERILALIEHLRTLQRD